MTRSRPLHLAVFGLFFLLLVSPWLAGLFGASSDTVERRAPAARPSLRGGALLDVDTFADLNEWVRDATPLRGDATGWLNRFWLAWDVSPQSNVVEGPDETLFLAEDFTAPCRRQYDLDEMTTQFAAYAEAAKAGGKEWVFLIAPDKGSVLDHRLTGRADWAASCSRDAREELRAALDETGVSFDLASMLIEADQVEPGRWYYEHDSHWTFDAGGLVAERIVDHFDSTLFVAEEIEPIQRSLPIRGDVYGRLGILKLRDEPDPVQVSLRSDVTTNRSEVQIGGTRTVRTYLSSGDGDVLAGRTVVVHDSMMNFVERQLASYFEHIDFIHWDDLAKADFFTKVNNADRVITVRVERNLDAAMNSWLLNPNFTTQFSEALSTARDTDLGLELQVAAEAMRRFTQDTGVFVQTFDDLLEGDGIEGWMGPYVDGEIYTTGTHPRYGDWGAEPSTTSSGLTACETIPGPPCGTWVSLAGVPDVLTDELDAEFDGSDGFESGRLRRGEDNTLFFYTFELAAR